MADNESGEDTSESYFINENGLKIFCRYWCEDLKNPRALVFVSHGAAEHCLWYNQLAFILKEAGCYVFAHDHVGHGQSEGDRVHVEDFHDYVRDVFQHFETVSAKFPNIPKYIIGHSMGGAIAIIAAIERPDFFDGMILIASAVVTDQEIATPFKAKDLVTIKYQVFFGRIAAKLCPQAPILYLDTSNISRNSAAVQQYIDDPLVYHGGLKARWGASFLKWLQWIENNMKQITCPLLVMHGTLDKLTKAKGSELLVKNASSTDKILKLYEGYYHQLHYEPGADGAGVRQDILDWIVTRLKPN